VERLFEQVHDIENEAIEINWSWSKTLSPREGKQVLNEPGAALRAAPRILEKSKGGGVLNVLFGELDVPRDRGQQIVEVMRDATGELAERVHLLCLPEFRLGNLTLSHFVAEDLFSPAPTH